MVTVILAISKILPMIMIGITAAAKIAVSPTMLYQAATMLRLRATARVK
jgi:hypothetical protein